MKNRILLMVILILLIFISIPVCYADNPIIKNIYTADPAPMVYNGICYVYTGHDEDITVNDFFTMNEWRCYSSTDMINWTDRGSPLNYRAFSWATGDAWAAQCVYRNGTFYYYVTLTRSGGARCIGVAVSSSPTGPFTDPLGRPLIANNGGEDIDPTVFIDDDGQAYLYWGNPNLYYVRLNQDMISYSGGIVRDSSKPSNYQEGPWVYKRNGIYYLVFATTCCSEAIGYATSNSPAGSWNYRGIIMPTQGSSFTNHPGVVDFNGGSFFFYHNGALPGGGGYHRSVCVEEFVYNADGTFPTINMTTAGVSGPARTPVSGETPDPTPVETPGPTGTPNQEPIWSGGPYTLNGSSDYIDLPDGLTNDLHDFSIACWVKLNSLDTWSRIFDFGSDTNVFMMLTPASGNTGYPYFCITTSGNDGEQGINGTSAMATGSWQHLAVTRSGNTGILYINTKEVGRNTGITLHPADMGNTTNNYIGRSQWSNDPYLNGEVDEFVVYNRSLSASEVSALGSTPPGGGTGTLGDANGDGAINIVDALLIAQEYVGLNPSGFIAANADTNCDGSINIVDALLVAQYYVGLIQSFC